MKHLNQLSLKLTIALLTVTIPKVALSQNKTVSNSSSNVKVAATLKPSSSAPNVTSEQIKMLINQQKIKQLSGGTGVDGGGGDEVGLEFQATLEKALANLKQTDSDSYRQLESRNLTSALRKLSVITVDNALNVQAKDLIQNSVAKNFQDLNLILVNRQRWAAIAYDTIKEGIALHEVSSLLGIEETGKYSISAKYVSLQGASVDQLKRSLALDRLSELKADHPQAKPYEILATYFAEAKDKISLGDFGGGKNPECFVTTKVENQLLRFYVARETLTMTPGQSAKGPLFPEVAAVTEPRIFWSVNNDDGLRLKNGIPNSFNWREWLSQNPVIPDWKKPSALRIASQELQQTSTGFRRTIQTFAKPADFEIRFRKNNGLIAFQLETHFEVPKENAPNDPLRSAVIDYGYCY
jgi:hypothetical protein